MAVRATTACWAAGAAREVMQARAAGWAGSFQYGPPVSGGWEGEGRRGDGLLCGEHVSEGQRAGEREREVHSAQARERERERGRGRGVLGEEECAW